MIVVSADFRAVSTSARAAMALSETERRGRSGFVQLATCNRTEWWADAASSLPSVPAGATVHQGDAAVRHVLRVALGLESLARGERHVSRQVHAAFDAARREGTSSPRLRALANAVGRAVRGVRGTEPWSASPGMHALVAAALDDVDGPVLVVGMGAIGRQVADRLGPRAIRVNRSPRTGCLPLSAEPPPHAAVVLCTSAPSPIWTRPGRVIDLGSPPQAHPDVGALGVDALVGTRLDPAAEATLEAAVEAGLADVHRRWARDPR